MMEELLSLKWNNHRSTFLHILTILRDKQLYTDATLACEGRFYSVHRLVLSTCSDYFSAMFDRTTCKNPIIVLKDIKCEDLEALLDYMYLGEVNVRQADLASLIKAAECLRVKGLAVPDDEPPQKRGRGDTSNLRKSEGAGSPPSKRKRREEGQDGREDIRPGGSGGSGNTNSRTKSPHSQSRLSPQPLQQESSEANSSPSSRLQQGSEASAQQGSNVPAPSALDGQSPFVKVEMEDTGGDDVGGDSFNINNDSFKEEGNDDQGGDLSNDLPEFLQQSTDGAYSHSFAGPSFQPDLPNWQGDQVLSSNNFSGLGTFPSQTQEGSQNTTGELLCGPKLAAHRQGAWGDGMVNLTSEAYYEMNYRSWTDAKATASSDVRCLVCGRTFHGVRRNRNLRRHMMLHRGDKPFKCTQCPYQSNQKSNVKKHFHNVHAHLSSKMSPIGAFPS